MEKYVEVLNIGEKPCGQGSRHRLIITELWTWYLASSQIIYEEPGPTRMLFWWFPARKKKKSNKITNICFQKAEFSKKNFKKSFVSQNWFPNLKSNPYKF